VCGCFPDVLDSNIAVTGSGDKFQTEIEMELWIPSVRAFEYILCCGMNMGPSVGFWFRISDKTCKKFSLWFVEKREKVICAKLLGN
jgi:hypothetical protein